MRGEFSLYKYHGDASDFPLSATFLSPFSPYHTLCIFAFPIDLIMLIIITETKITLQINKQVIYFFSLLTDFEIGNRIFNCRVRTTVASAGQASWVARLPAAVTRLASVPMASVTSMRTV